MKTDFLRSLQNRKITNLVLYQMAEEKFRAVFIYYDYTADELDF